MKKNYTFLKLFFCLLTTYTYAQIPLYSNGFEGPDEDTYNLTNSLDNNVDFTLFNVPSDYFSRVSPSYTYIDVDPTNIEGSTIIAGEDFDGYVGGTGEIRLTTNSFSVAGAVDMSVSLKVGATNDGLDRYEPSNYLIVEYELDGSNTWVKIGEFRGVTEPGGMFNFFEDDDLNGSATVRTTNVMRDVSYNLNSRAGSTISGTNMRVRIRLNFGVQEEIVLDDIVVEAVSSTLSNQDFDLDNDFSIFPNPSNGNITIKNSGIALDRVEISDLNGRVVFNQDLNGIREDKALNLSSKLSSGMYLMTLTSNNASTVKKLIIE